MIGAELFSLHSLVFILVVPRVIINLSIQLNKLQSFVEYLIVFLMYCYVSLQRLCVRQQEQPSDEGTGGPASVEGRRAVPHSLRSPGSGHGQRHLPQVNQSI